MVVNIIDFAISAGIFVALMVWYRFIPSFQVFTLPFFMLIAVATSLGICYWISALNVKYRDFRYIVPFMIQIGLYVSPVGFSSSIVPDKWKYLYFLNPMVGVIDGFRWGILGSANNVNLIYLAISSIVAISLFVSGFFFFRHMEHEFADVI